MKRKVSLLLIILLISIGLIGCKDKEDVGKEVTGKDKETVVGKENDYSDLGTVKVGMDGETPPFTTIGDNGEVAGFEVALWEEMAKRTGFVVEFERMEFSSLFSMLDDKRLDVVANSITINPEREEKYLFSDGYTYEKNMLLAKTDRKIEDLKDMDGWSIAVEPATVDEEIVRKFEKMADIKLERTFYDGAAIQDVILGRVDLWIKGEAGCLEVIEEIGDDKLQIIADTTDIAVSGYPFFKNERGERLKNATNYALEEIRKDGTMTKLADEYFAVDITKVLGQN